MTDNNVDATHNETERRTHGPAIRVMLVDDSAVIRGMLTRIIESDPQLQVVSSASDGAMALAILRTRPVDVLVLDLEMPNMDGLTALPKLKETQPSVKIIIVSSLTRENAEIAMRAMRLGAEDYLSKPNTTSEMTSVTAFRRDVVNKIKALGGHALASDPLAADGGYTPSPPVPPVSPPGAADRPLTRLSERKIATTASDGGTLLTGAKPQAVRTPILPIAKKPPAVISLRPMPHFFDAEAVAFGSSTGGPQALFTILADWPTALQQPIFITQHMPPTFTTILGEHVSRVSKRHAAEAQDGEIVQPGRIYIAPGDYHMVIEESGGQKILRVRQTPPENYCRPSVDPMFKSLSQAYHAKLLAVMLTGMGRVGLGGTEQVIKAGGLAVAQDEASSVVWGMPGTVAQAGLCSALVPLNDISGFVQKLLLRGEA